MRWKGFACFRSSGFWNLHFSRQRGTQRTYTEFDPRLVDDGTDYALEFAGKIAASPGWSRRAALVRRAGDKPWMNGSSTRHATFAAVLATYTHPDFGRTGLGTILLATANTAARLAGFCRAELIATSAGRGLYLARGWREAHRIKLGPDDGSAIVAFLMQRDLCGE
jgi:GNAT superfamily N-acetyltransferase